MKVLLKAGESYSLIVGPKSTKLQDGARSGEAGLLKKFITSKLNAPVNKAPAKYIMPFASLLKNDINTRHVPNRRGAMYEKNFMMLVNVNFIAMIYILNQRFKSVI